ncbi:glutamate 5-kinase [Candidatus Poribacteria bacterium]|nr:glutamate 5-kinase [Candidatus Poribacteria bacterium]
MKKIDRKSLFKSVKKIVVKVGTSSITSPDMSLDLGRIENLSLDLIKLHKTDKDVILVTSGAIATGMGQLGWKTRPRDIPRQQAAAAVGQGHLMHTYKQIFEKHGQLVAQVLLTQDDICDRKRYTNANNTISTLLQYDVIPIINENDTVAVEEIKFGDNDTLSALVANLIKADLLLILSDIDGFYNFEKKIISVIPSVTTEIHSMAGGKGSNVSVGGMTTKLQAAEIVTGAGDIMVIANGCKAGIIERILNGEEEGTVFLPAGDKMSGKKRWIAYSVPTKGKIKVDSGAKKALTKYGKSLLPSGITSVEGKFEFGDAISCTGEDDKEFARGLANYSSEEVEKIKGKKTEQIESILGHIYYDEVIHRDNLVIL